MVKLLGSSRGSRYSLQLRLERATGWEHWDSSSSELVMRLFPDLIPEMELWWLAGWNKSVASHLPTVRPWRQRS